jgi:hypothetical protein
MKVIFESEGMHIQSLIDTNTEEKLITPQKTGESLATPSSMPLQQWLQCT